MKSSPCKICSKKFPLFIFTLCISLSGSVVGVELGVGFRSMGFMFEAGHKFSESFNARLAYGGMYFVGTGEMDQPEIPTANDIFFDAQGSGEFKQLSLLIDYHPGRGNFRFTGGVANNRIILEAVNFGNDEVNKYFTIDDKDYSGAIVESTELVMQLTNGVSPYFGFGWATGFDKEKGFSFNGDIGFFYATDFAINFSAECADKATLLQCTKLKTSAMREQVHLNKDLELLLLPMVGLGLSYKF